jgi:hypothetical protein
LNQMLPHYSNHPKNKCDDAVHRDMYMRDSKVGTVQYKILTQITFEAQQKVRSTCYQGISIRIPPTMATVCNDHRIELITKW